ncbi:hypothetical protein ACJJTC_006164, partial [Scirpophaga incertulas]
FPTTVAGRQRGVGCGVLVVWRRVRRGAEGAPAAATAGALPRALPPVLPAPPDRHHAAAARRAPQAISGRRPRARRVRVRVRGRGRRAPLRRARAAAPAARRAALLRVRLRRLPAAPPPQQAEGQEAPAARAARARRQAQEPRGLHHVPVGVPAEAAAGPRVLPALHQVDQSREGRVQARRLQGRVAPVGAAQEQAGHELRDHGPRAALLLPARHPGQGGRPAARVPVRRRAQGHRRDRLLARVSGAGAGISKRVCVTNCERTLFDLDSFRYHVFSPLDICTTGISTGCVALRPLPRVDTCTDRNNID